jgi:hypothetical protein
MAVGRLLSLWQAELDPKATLQSPGDRWMTDGIDPRLTSYAEEYLTRRLRGFGKDIKICLAGIPRDNQPDRDTHAYFPALITCCAMLELLGSLYKGKPKSTDINRVTKYCAAFMPQPDYSTGNIDLLFYVLRHPTAHLSTGSGVRIPKEGVHRDKRITFYIDEQPGVPAINLKPKSGEVTRTGRYWSCPFDHVLCVYLPSLQKDIHDSVVAPGKYRDTLLASDDLLGNFLKCMKEIFPERRLMAGSGILGFF